jgi:hypothetical protein
MAQKYLTNLDLNQNELQNAVVQNLASAPGAPIAGQLYFDTNGSLNHIKVYNGTSWDDLTEGDISGVTAGTGLAGGGTSGTVTLNIDTTGVTAASYGSSTAIPVLTINAQGQITAASTASITTTLSIAGDGATSDSVALATDTLTFAGDTGITATVASDTVTIDLDDTAVTVGSYGAADTVSTFTVDQQGRLTAAGQTSISILSSQVSDLSSNTVSSLTGTANEVEVSASTGAVTVGLPNDVIIGNDLTVTNDLTVSGNLTVTGTSTTVDTATLTVEDPLIILGSNNDTTDAVDIGFYGLYDTSGSQDLYAGLFRDADDSGKFKLFVDSQTAPTTTVDTAATGYTIGTLVANVEGGTVSGLTSDIAVVDGGTGASTETNARTNLGVSTGTPTTSTSTLARIAAQDCAASSGSTSTTTVTHNFGTKDVIVQVFDTSTGATVVGDVARGTTNAVTVTLNGSSITAGDYRIVVTSA